MTTSNEPIACTLSETGAARQSLEWADLSGHAVSSEQLDTGVAMTFEPGMAAAVEDLAAREAACCSFLSISTTQTDDEVRIEITSDNPDALPMIRSIAGATPK
jgi:hypothetical protein